MNFFSKTLLLLILTASLSCESVTCDYYITKYRNEVETKLSKCSGEEGCIIVGANCPLGCFYAINKIHAKRVEEMMQKLWKVCPPCKTECVFPYPKEAVCLKGNCQSKLSE